MQAKWANFFNNYSTSTIISNNEYQEQQHKDHDATTRIQSISRGFIHQKQIHLKMQQDHAEEILHFDNLLRSFTNDFKVITIKC
eukprot:6891070-Ditylum_brightwellii.AAC.1